MYGLCPDGPARKAVNTLALSTHFFTFHLTLVPIPLRQFNSAPHVAVIPSTVGLRRNNSHTPVAETATPFSSPMAGSATDSNMPPYGPNDVRMAAARVIARGGNVSVDDEGVCRYVLAQNCHPCALLLDEWLLQSTAFMVAGLSLAWFSVCQILVFLIHTR